MNPLKVALPEIPKKEFNIKDFGAVSNGEVSNTHAIATTIQAACELGGGTIIIPPGVWRTGPIELKSNINLHACKGAVILFEKNPEEYPVFVADFEGQPRIRTLSPIYARDAENIAITGAGIFDGNGHLWRPLKEGKVTSNHWKECLKKGGHALPDRPSGNGMWMPSETAYRGYMEGEPDIFAPNADIKTALKKAAECYDYYRPVMVSLVNCKKVLIEGVTLQNSPAWNVHPLFCTDLTIRNAVIRNPYYAQNGDGVDVESCKNVHIHDTRFDVGDDAICIKAGKDAVGRQKAGVTENVHIHDCIVYHGHGGFVVGSEMSRGVRHILVENCTFMGTDTGLRFKSALGRGGVVEDIHIKDIQMVDIKREAIVFDMGYMFGGAEAERPEITKEDIPEFKNICMENISCLGAERGIKIVGLEEQPVHNITIKNSWFQVEKAYIQKHTENIILYKVTMSGR